MNKILTILLLTLVVPCISFASENMQQTAIDKLIEDYQTKHRPSEPQNQESEIRRLKSQLIDLSVERDQLAEQVLYLQNTINNMSVDEEHTELHNECLEVECIPITVVENDKILTYVIYTLSQYRLAELMDGLVPEENVEAHNQAQKIMIGAKNDLNILGFDTSDMDQYPTLNELLEQWIISQGSRATW